MKSKAPIVHSFIDKMKSRATIVLSLSLSLSLRLHRCSCLSLSLYLFLSLSLSLEEVKSVAPLHFFSDKEKSGASVLYSLIEKNEEWSLRALLLH